MCAMQDTLYVETPSHTMYRNLSKSSITNNTVRKDVPTSHQRVQSSELVLNRKQNAFQTHLT